MLWANVDAGRFKADVNPVGTVITLGRRAGVRVNVERIVRTGLHAGFTADAPVFVEVHNAIGPDVKRFNGADFHAWRIGAVVAAQDGKKPSGMREVALFNLLDVGAEHAHGYIVFRFAGGGAGMAANALSVINDETVFHKMAVS